MSLALQVVITYYCPVPLLTRNSVLGREVSSFHSFKGEKGPGV